MNICDAHNAAWGSRKGLLCGEGFLFAARFLQNSVIQDKFIDRMAGIGGVSRELLKLQLESIQGAGPWLICDECMSLLKLSDLDKNAAREAAKKFWKNNNTPGYMPGQKTGERNKKPAYFMIIGNGFTPSKIQAHFILREWLEHVKDRLGELDGGGIRMELSSRERTSLVELLKVFNEVKKSHVGQLVDGLFLQDKKTGQDITLIAVWAPEDSEYVGSLLHRGKSQNIDKEKQPSIFDILMDAACCVIFADGKVTNEERKAVYTIMEKTKSSWTKKSIDNRIDGFLDRFKTEGIDKIVQTTCEMLPEFKRRKKQKVLIACLDFISRADGMMDENEKKIIEKFKSAVANSGDKSNSMSNSGNSGDIIHIFP
jgi:tellurite resistance protein